MFTNYKLQITNYKLQITNYKLIKLLGGILLVLITYQSNYGQLAGNNNGYANLITDFNGVLLSGFYNVNNSNLAFPDNSNQYQHLLVVRHPNSGNNIQLQIASTITPSIAGTAGGDRLFFRKILGGLGSSTSGIVWNEMAIRNGSNTFTGDQKIIGNLVLGNIAGLTTISGPPQTNGGAIQMKTNNNLGGPDNRYMRFGWRDNNSIFIPLMSITDDNKVGIGTTKPNSLLDVAGNITCNSLNSSTIMTASNINSTNDYNSPHS